MFRSMRGSMRARADERIRSLPGDAPVLDRFIPRPIARARHETLVAAPADVVFAVVREFDLESVPLVHAIVWLRAHLMRGTWRKHVPRGFFEETRALGWGDLVDVPGRLHVAGAVCQPWRADVTFTPVPPERFRAYAEPDLVKIAWTMEAEPLGPERTRLASETRVDATDAGARRKFRRYWAMFGIGIVAIRWLSFPVIRREAERRWRASRRPPRPGRRERPSTRRWRAAQEATMW